jgi:hypothetical protein
LEYTSSYGIKDAVDLKKSINNEGHSAMYNSWQATMNDDIVIIKQLDELKDQHRQLDEEINQLMGAGSDEMQLARLKKRKLQLRDQIQTLEVEIYPDMPA